MDTVSHFFLTDDDARGVLPRRVSPGREPIKEGEGDASPLSEICIMLCPDEFPLQGSFLGCMLALSLAAYDVSVGLIETTTKLPHTFFLSGGYGNLDAVFWEEELDSPDFSNMVARFRNASDFVLINAAASILFKTSDHTGWMGRCLVPTTVRPQDLLGAYGTIKNASERWAMAEIDLIVIKQRSTDNAGGAAVVLEKMARRFLACSVSFVGAVVLPDDIDSSGVLSSMLSPQAQPNVTAAAVKEIARHLIVSGNSQKKRKRHVEKRL